MSGDDAQRPNTIIGIDFSPEALAKLEQFDKVQSYDSGQVACLKIVLDLLYGLPKPSIRPEVSALAERFTEDNAQALEHLAEFLHFHGKPATELDEKATLALERLAFLVQSMDWIIAMGCLMPFIKVGFTSFPIRQAIVAQVSDQLRPDSEHVNIERVLEYVKAKYSIDIQFKGE